MEEFIKRVDRSRIRVKTRNKIPQVLDWVNYKEKQSIHKLLSENREYGLRTGTKIGNYWFCALDLDEKGWVKTCEYLSYVKTKRGIHVYLLIGGKKSPKNFMLFYQGKRIGSFLSKGRQVVGIGSVHETGFIYRLVKRGKWFWKFESMEKLRERLAKFAIELR